MTIEHFIAGDSTPAEFEAVRGLPEVPVEPVAPGVECLVAWESDRPVARLSLHLRDDLRGAPGRSGLVGHYEALDREAGTALLAAACLELTSRGAVRVLGPMNGSTWSRYRLALPAEPGDPLRDPPPFAAEPRNPFDYPGHFDAAGFARVARYESRLDDLREDAPDADDVALRVAEAGFSCRPLDLDRFDEELEVLFRLSLQAFTENPYYTPINLTEFRGMYVPLRTLMDPEFVLLAFDHEGHACGYLFAFADPASARGGRPRRIIAKTVAVAPAARGHGVANHLLDRIRRSARDLGYDEMIHALMHVANVSTRMSARHGGTIFRRYALWQWTP